MRFIKGTCGVVVIFGSASMLALGCASAQERAESPPPDITPVEPPELPQPSQQPSDRFLRLDVGEGLEACPLAQPHFAFDRDKERLLDAAELAEFAQCIAAPQQQHIQLVLVGRTDPEGTREYNQDLGMARAESVKGTLVEHGVSPSRIIVRSAGESGASVTGEEDDYSQGFDRRVDIVQIGVVHAPEGAEESLVGGH